MFTNFDNLQVISLPYPDVLERLKVAWEKARAQLKDPPKPQLHCNPVGEYAARLELYTTRSDRLFPDIAVVLEIEAADQNTYLTIKRDDGPLLRNWLKTFEADLPTGTHIQKCSAWLKAKREQQGTPADWLGVGKASDGGGQIEVERYTRIKAEVYKGRCKEVLEQVCKGLANPDIVKKLGLADSTVKDYVSKLYKAFGINTSMVGTKIAREQLADEGSDWLEWDATSK